MGIQPTDIRKHRDGGGLLLVACTLIGLGIGIALDFVPEGLFFGLGVGFLVMALWRIGPESTSPGYGLSID